MNTTLMWHSFYSKNTFSEGYDSNFPTPATSLSTIFFFEKKDFLLFTPREQENIFFFYYELYTHKTNF